jgi:GT2 family glycosyltransferase
LVPSACAALYRREMLDEIGLFDEEFFMYCEDMDLGLRGRWAGWKALAAPRATVYHRYSASSGAYSPLKMYFVERNHYSVAVKNFPMQLLLALPVWTLCRYVLMARALWSSEGKGRAGDKVALLSAFVRGHVAALAHAPRAFRRRAPLRRLSGSEFMGLLAKHRLSQRRLILCE